MRGLNLGLCLSKGSTGFSLPSLSGTQKIIIIGDSLTQRNNTMTTTKSLSRADGYFYWASRDIPSLKTGIWYDATATSGAAPPLFRGFNFGISGEAADDVAARTTPIINYGAPVAILLCGTNTGDDNSSFSAKTTSIQSILDDLTSNGYFVILGTIWPRTVSETPTGSEISTAYRDTLLQVNDWIRGKESNSIAIWDPVEDLIDTQYSPGDTLYFNPKSGVLEDGVHPTTMGAYSAAITLRPILQSIFDNSNQYTDAWFNSLTNLITNGTLTGSSGFGQNGVSGSVPTNFVSKFVVSDADVSAVATNEANSDTSGQSHKVVITCGGNGSSTAVHTYQLQPLAGIVNEGGISNGDYVRYFAKIRIRNNTDGLIGAAQLRLFNQTQSRNDYMFEATATTQQDEPFPTGDFDIWLQTQPTEYTTNDIYQPILNLSIFKNVSGTVDLYIDKVQLSVVGDPETEFPYTT